MEEVNLKDITQRTLGMMKRDSRFRIIEGKDLVMVEKKKRVIDKYEMERRLLCGGLTPQDLHIMRFLAMLTYSDVDMLTYVAGRFRRENPEMPIVLDKSVIRDILKKLYNMFLVAIKEQKKVVSYDDVPEDASPWLYCLTDFGLSVLRKQLDYREYAEEQMTLFGQGEVFRRVSANYVGCFTQKLLPEWKLSTCRMTYIKGVGKHIVYAKVENDERVIIIEPLFFSYVKDIMTEEDILKFEEQRMSLLKSLFKDEKDKKKYLVIVIEGFSALKKSLKFIRDNELDDGTGIEAILYTTVQSVVYSDALEEAELVNGYIREAYNQLEDKSRIYAISNNPFIE